MYNPNAGIVFFLLGVAVLMLMIGTMRDENEEVSYDNYCSMVALWHEFDHLPPKERPGWPPYKGECEEVIDFDKWVEDKKKENGPQ